MAKLNNIETIGLISATIAGGGIAYYYLIFKIPGTTLTIPEFKKEFKTVSLENNKKTWENASKLFGKEFTKPLTWDFSGQKSEGAQKWVVGTVEGILKDVYAQKNYTKNIPIYDYFRNSRRRYATNSDILKEDIYPFNESFWLSIQQDFFKQLVMYIYQYSVVKNFNVRNELNLTSQRAKSGEYMGGDEVFELDTLKIMPGVNDIFKATNWLKKTY